MKTAKRPVVLRPFRYPRYSFDALRVCTRCSRYTALAGERCPACGRSSLLPVEAKAASLASKRRTVRLAAVLVLSAAAVYFAADGSQRFIALAAGLLLTVLLSWLQLRARLTEDIRSLDELFRRDIGLIREGLEGDRQEAVSVLREDDVLAYEKLREVSVLLRGDRVSRQRVALLHGFQLRKDMDLEMESLILRDFEPLLAEYIGEVAKLKPELIKDRTLRYCQLHEAQILEMREGPAILTAVAAAAVRMKRYCLLYSGFIGRYADGLPSDRFLRLLRLVQADPREAWNGLDAIVRDIAGNRGIPEARSH
ncbi:hypothetical protein [Paenibacillus glufosinatiresistens]|uniref:hypothetical protein n=1 Tax=Paenibacillus glufosinatiresistens TaxID=3070657 RepID=UPI00286DFFE8|nr:hypothetical protein [Paenibacillus sp. YX.27]